jgi:FKBP-type peptidyl-prolyl cis-trans isomerase
MRSTIAAISITVLTLAACSGSDSDADPVDSEAPVESDVAADDPAADETSDDAATDDTTTDDTTTDTAELTPSTTQNPDKPEVEIPDELPTELQRNVIVEGTGEPAEVGDTVIVNYVGVRSSDGEEFDNSYDRQPFPVTLGNGSVIQGWEEGLVGARTGEQVQLDIPSDLAYGPEARGELIGENEDLTFVIDVLAVVGAADPADAPTEPGVELSTGEGVTETQYEDVVVGDGPALEQGSTAVIRYVNFRGDNGVQIESNWGAEPLSIPFEEGLLPGLLVGMEGMKVGGTRAITIPPEEGFGPEGNPQGGLPADTDMIFVIDLLGTY